MAPPAGLSLIWAQAVPYRVDEEFPACGGSTPWPTSAGAGTIMEAVEGGMLLGFMIVAFLPLVRRELRSPSPGMDRLGRIRAGATET